MTDFHSLSSTSRDRYQRQMALPGFDAQSQTAICSSHVAVVGAGGLGSPVLAYLAAAGVGKLTIIDGDAVELANLHRQIIHTPEMIGVKKSGSAREALEVLNPEVDLKEIPERLTHRNALSILAECDLVCDCSDNFETRFMIDEVCSQLQLPVVYGAITGWHAQAIVFLHNSPLDTNIKDVRLRDLFPEQPDGDAVPGSAIAGILGPAAGMIGCLMATEALKIIGGLGTTLSGKLVSIDTRNMTWQEIILHSQENSSHDQ